ncbi:MAG TPA: hypothetical protein PK055_00610 [Gammaproteobacteria bacterium]|nr:hypothetical protein [Xanthomonadales bacterium]MCB1593900.1 hypothetical protein [Xanthomonadales bacterium]HOP22620.1 hypothetical protein [Gammaproteobacteria bacterium]HPI94689.1 hypothetical protein [Gammaproteobacteria bacterium]HPQ86134.1 hypothetical protein [Gammaproteobacteria bacterium]
MNLFKAIYCNQYFELKPKGKENSAKKNGTVLSAIALLLYFFSVFFILLLLFPDLGREIEGVFKDVFGRRTGRLAAKISVGVIMVLCFIIVKFTLDKDSVYNKTITEFESMSGEQQAKISKQGLIFFISSIVLVVGSLMVFLMIRG